MSSPHDPKYDGTQVFMPKFDLLLPGDILLSRNMEASSFKDRRVADLIAKFSNGEFSHAMICLTPPTFVEAISTGVGNISILNGFVHSTKNVCVLRYPDAEIAKLAANHAAFFVGKEYSIGKAIRSVFPGSGSSDTWNEGIFCSALVAEVFQMANAPEFQGLNPSKVTPSSIRDMHFLIDLTTHVFAPSIAPKNIEEMTAIDGDRRETPSSKQTAVLNAYYKKLKFEIEDKMSPHFEGLRPLNFYDCIKMISHFMLKNPEWFDSLPESPKRAVQAVDESAFLLLSDNRMQDVMNEMIEIDMTSINYILKQSHEALPDFDVEGLKMTLNITKEQIEARQSLPNSFRDRKIGRCRSLDKWLEMNEDVIEFLRYRQETLTEVLKRVGAYPT